MTKATATSKETNDANANDEVRTAERVQKDIDELDKRIAEFEKELSSMPGEAISWEEYKTVEEVQNLESRRGIVRRLLDAAKVRRLELSKEKLEVDIVPMAAVRTERDQQMQELDAQIKELKEQRNKVYIDWAHENQRVTNKEHHIKRIDREIRELRGEEAK